jgi:hypothetical protein
MYVVQCLKIDYRLGSDPTISSVVPVLGGLRAPTGTSYASTAAVILAGIRSTSSVTPTGPTASWDKSGLIFGSI